MAPRDGLEPPTKWLQVPWYFYQAWTISSPVPNTRDEGVGRFPSDFVSESTSQSSSLCTFPEQQWFRAWLRITILHLKRRAGFPEFTRFFNHDFSWKLQLNSHPLYQLSYRGKYNSTLSGFFFHVNQIVRANSISENSLLTREAVTSSLASKQG